MVEIVTASPEDAPAMRALFEEAFAPISARIGYRPSPMFRRFDTAIEARTVFKAVTAEAGPAAAPVGFIVFSAHPTHAYVDAIAVRADHRRAGVGRALLAAVERLAAEMCFPAVELNTDPALAEAVRFYWRAGYRMTGGSRSGGVDTVRFRKPIETALEKMLRLPLA